MNGKKLTVKKLYSSMTADEMKKNSRITLAASVVTVFTAVILLFVRQNSLLALFNKYYWVGSVVVMGSLALNVFTIYCLIGHFTVYKLREEWYENQLPALRGNWHTFAAIEIQMVLFLLFTAFEIYLLTTGWDLGTFICALITLIGFSASVVVRSISYKAIKGLSDKPVVQPEHSDVSEEVEEFFD